VASELEDDDGHQAAKLTTPAQTYQAKPQPQQPKPQSSGQWWTDLGLSTDDSIKAATMILVSKGWLQEGDTLKDLSEFQVKELSNPKMRQAFLEAVKSKLS
jgi:hypothetical protein